MSILTVSDHAGIGEQSSSGLRFLRPITEGNNYKHAAPGARVSFVTNSDLVGFRVYWNALITRSDTFNSLCSVLVDGVETGTFSCPYAWNVTGESYHLFTVSASSKTVTLVWPLAAGMELKSVGVRPLSTMSPASRPETAIAVCGDSISQGLSISKTILSWAYLLSVAKGRQILNLANGSERAESANGSALSGLPVAPSAVTYLIGFNDFAANLATATFQSRVEGWITNARAALPSAHLYIISPLYSTKVAADYGHATELSSYRAAVLAAEAAAGDANTTYVDGLSLITNSADRFVDGIHPNSTGASEMSASLTSIIA